MNLARRGILKLLGAAPAVAAAAPALATQAAGLAVPGLMVSGGASVGLPINATGPSPRRTITSLASFVLDQEKTWRSKAKDIHRVDPDIASMRLPLGTKCRMQAERNYEKIRQRESDWFLEVLGSEGQVRVW